MAKANPPKKGKKGTPPSTNSPIKNTLKTVQEDKLVPMNFKVPAQFKKDYQLYAINSGNSMVDILKASFELYESQNPT